MRLAAVAQVARDLDARTRRAQLGDGRRDRGVGQLLAAQHQRALHLRAAVRGGQPECAQHAARGRDQDAPDPELVGQVGGVQRAGAAERQQREGARVQPALHGHDAQRADHLGVGHADDPVRAFLGAQAELAREPLDRARAPLRRRARTPLSGRRGVEPAQHQVRVGDRRLAAAAPVGGGPGLRARRARPHAQRAAAVAPADRAAAGADRVDVDHRQRQRAAADLAPGGLAHDAVLDDRHVARRAAHVEAQEVRLAGGGRHERGGSRTAGGPAQHRQRGVVGGGLQAGQAAAGLHDPRLGQPALRRALGERAQVGADERRERRVDLGGRRALVLAERPGDLVRERHVDAGAQPRAQRRAERTLVRGVAVGVQQAHGNRLGAARRDLLGQTRRQPRAARSTPAGPMRSRAPKRRSGGANGAGQAAHSRYRSRRAWRPSSTRSVKPSVATNAVRAPRPSSSALVATVIPCASSSTASGLAPARSSTTSIAAMTPCDWSAGVVGALAVCTPPDATSTASVNVPPTSTPTSMPGPYPGTRLRYAATPISSSSVSARC